MRSYVLKGTHYDPRTRLAHFVRERFMSWSKFLLLEVLSNDLSLDHFAIQNFELTPTFPINALAVNVSAQIIVPLNNGLDVSTFVHISICSGDKVSGGYFMNSLFPSLLQERGATKYFVTQCTAVSLSHCKISPTKISTSSCGY